MKALERDSSHSVTSSCWRHPQSHRCWGHELDPLGCPARPIPGCLQPLGPEAGLLLKHKGSCSSGPSRRPERAGAVASGQCLSCRPNRRLPRCALNSLDSEAESGEEHLQAMVLRVAGSPRELEEAGRVPLAPSEGTRPACRPCGNPRMSFSPLCEGLCPISRGSPGPANERWWVGGRKVHHVRVPTRQQATEADEA